MSVDRLSVDQGGLKYITYPAIYNKDHVGSTMVWAWPVFLYVLRRPYIREDSWCDIFVLHGNCFADISINQCLRSFSLTEPHVLWPKLLYPGTLNASPQISNHTLSFPDKIELNLNRDAYVCFADLERNLKYWSGQPCWFRAGAFYPR